MLLDLGLRDVAGFEVLRRLLIGTTVFGGMLAATVLTPIFVPVFYAVVEGLRARSEPG